MKRAILTLIVASAALVGCQRDNATESTPVPLPENAIQLATGMDAAVFQYGMMTKSGVRDEKGFKVGDHIGVTAIYSKDASAGITDDAPNLSVNRWFDNKPATAEAAVGTPAGTPSSWYNPFHWGLGATSTPATASDAGDYQFYPQGRFIFLYAYYPLAKGTSGGDANGVEFIAGTVASDVTATYDKIKVTLQPETLNTGVDVSGNDSEPDKALTLKQPDVMVGANAKRNGADIASVNRKSPIADVQLNFQHVLAQLRLKISRTAEVKELPILQKVEIAWPKVATYEIKEVASAPQDLPAQSTVDGKKTYADADLVKHTITCNIEIPQGDFEAATDILGALNKEVIMLHPLTQAQLEGCIIKITIKFPSIANPKVFDISLTSLNNGIQQGKCNIVSFQVNYVKYDITADVAEWNANGETGGMDID